MLTFICHSKVKTKRWKLLGRILLFDFCIKGYNNISVEDSDISIEDSQNYFKVTYQKKLFQSQ